MRCNRNTRKKYNNCIIFKKKYIRDDDDYTYCKYGILIIDSIKYQIKTKICKLINAEKLYYFGDNKLYSFGFRTFCKLNLEKLKL